MSYSLYDFTESLSAARRDGAAPQNEEIKSCVAAWGFSPEGYGSWTGGFLLALKDGRFAYISGWCDTTGWGCQDGAGCQFFDALPELWDMDPVDLNRWIADGCPESRAW